MEPALRLDDADRLRGWIHAPPREWETEPQFVRRINVIAARFPHALARRWIEEELAHAALLRDARYSEGYIEQSDLAWQAEKDAGAAYRKMRSAGAADTEASAEPVEIYDRLESVAEQGDGPAFRDVAARVEWYVDRLRDARAWVDLADAFETAGEPRAAEAFLVRALSEYLFQQGTANFNLPALAESRAAFRVRLRGLLDENGLDRTAEAGPVHAFPIILGKRRRG